MGMTAIPVALLPVFAKEPDRAVTIVKTHRMPTCPVNQRGRRPARSTN